MYPRDLREALRAALGGTPPLGDGAGRQLAAVLLPLIDGGHEPTVVFTKRTEGLPRHAGEISFPGGFHQEGDADLVETALRETEEELGIPRGAIEVLGALEPLATFSTRLLIAPFVGALRARPSFRPNPAEIAAVLEFPLSRLKEAEREVELVRGSSTFAGFVYELDGHTIWGATGRILHQFLDVLGADVSWAAGR